MVRARHERSLVGLLNSNGQHHGSAFSSKALREISLYVGFRVYRDSFYVCAKKQPSIDDLGHVAAIPPEKVPHALLALFWNEAGQNSLIAGSGLLCEAISAFLDICIDSCHRLIQHT
jgi:hypothetical protein